MVKEYCEDESLEEFTNYLNSMSDEDVYNYSPLYFDVFQDGEVLKKAEMMLVAIAKVDGYKAGKFLAELLFLVEKLKKEHALPKWEEQMKQENKEDVV